MRVNVPGVAQHDVTVNLADAATSAGTTDADLTGLLNTAIQNALNAAFGPDYTGAVPQLVRADIVASGSGYRLVLTALEQSAPGTGRRIPHCQRHRRRRQPVRFRRQRLRQSGRRQQGHQ